MSRANDGGALGDAAPPASPAAGAAAAVQQQQPSLLPTTAPPPAPPPPPPPPPSVPMSSEGRGASSTSPDRDRVVDCEPTPLRRRGSEGGGTPANRVTDSAIQEAESPPPKAPTRARMIEAEPVESRVAGHVDPSTVGAAVVASAVTAQAVVADGAVVQGRLLRTSAEPRAANDLPITRGRAAAGDARESATPTAAGAAGGAAASEASGEGQQLSDLQAHLQQMREQTKGRSLMARYVLQNAVRDGQNAETAASSSSLSPRGIVKMVHGVPRLRFRNQQVFRRKIILLGYQEVGKTSLRKCFESEPFFFKSLPEVRTTTGVEVQEKSMSVEGDSVDIILSDFAGQESYHSHTYFLTERAIFVLVWKLSAVEQDFQSSGINAREEGRLQRWIAEVFAKYPQARIVLVATHLDELRVQGQRSVEMILSKVEGKLRSYIDDLIAASTMPAAAAAPAATSSTAAVAASSAAAAAAAASLSSKEHAGLQRDPRRVIVGNFAVSCKTRLIIAAGNSLRHLSGEKISGLLRYLGTLVKDDCLGDREYPAAAVPGRHAKLMEDIEAVKRRHPVKLLMRLGEFVQMAVNVGIESEGELLQAARLMHSWDVIYLFNQYSIEANPLIVLYPRWLNRMSAALFSYAHLLRTPLHMRSMIGGLEYMVSSAETADMCLMRKGYLRWPLARVLFHKPLSDFLRRPPDDADIAMCVELLEAMQLVYPVEVESDEFEVLAEEVPVDPSVGRPVVKSQKITRYYVPSLAPLETPQVLKKLAPVLFHRGVRVRFEFNLLPDELWWRLQCKLHRLIKAVTVYQPALGGVDDEDILLNGFRLREADEEHSRWRDSLWLMGRGCRVLVYRDGASAVSVLSAENTSRGSEEVLQAVEETLLALLQEYKGVQRRTYVACPNQDCGGWLEADVVASCVRVSCPTCRQSFESKQVVSSGVGPLGAPHFSQSLLVEAGELLAFCLSYRSCLHMCRYLGIPYKGPSPAREESTDAAAAESDSSQSDVLGTHVEYLHALDKVVQAVLFRSWMERAEEQERRRRMLEDEPTPSYF
ncbi:Miro-like protein/Ras family [Novymonas esmeraldas]|uniref:Miro-like protein/Ras family n=1 Tax=Novymonas esmeraldas TaxID=1808958 RepID=A0AAW0EWN1_9TRYP